MARFTSELNEKNSAEHVNHDEINLQPNENPIQHDLGTSENVEDDSSAKKESTVSATEAESKTDPVQSSAIPEGGDEKKEVNEAVVNDAVEKAQEEKDTTEAGEKHAETSEKASSPIITLSDLFSDTASLSRTSLAVPEEANTRLFLLSQQLSSDQPGAHSQNRFTLDLDLLRRVLLFDPVPSLPAEYRNGLLLCLLGVGSFPSAHGQVKKENVAKVESHSWHAASLNTALIEDYITHCSDHFLSGARTVVVLALEPLTAEVLESVLWVVSGVIELTSSRYHHRDCRVSV